MPRHDEQAALLADGDLVTARLDHWASVSGDRPFFHYGETGATLTFADFARRANSIAGNLVGHGVGKGDRISVFCTNPLLGALIMFGAWKAGALYCPVNPAYSRHLLAHQLKDTGPRLIVTEPALLPALSEVAGLLTNRPEVVVCDDPIQPGSRAAPRGTNILPELSWSQLTTDAAAPDVSLAFDDPANVVYTSGTTGNSKGVVQSFRWLNHYTYRLRQPLTTDDVIYSDLPMHHVGGAFANVARAAWTGCEVAVWDRFSPSDFWRRIGSRGATTAILLDVMIPWLTNAPQTPADRYNTLNKVHMQPLPLHHADVARRFGFDFITAGFGQTECGAPLSVLLKETAEGEGTPPHLYRGLSHQEMAESASRHGVAVVPGAEAGRKGLMGLPTPFVEVTVLNDHDEHCGIEEPGQLALRPLLPSIFLMEYLGNPGATAAAFRNLWFHTGDAALRGADGMFYFVDRMGDRMRVRGENLSSSQVEDLLNQHSAISCSAVFAIPSHEGDEDDVVACLVLTRPGAVTEEQIRTYCADYMPKYMRPRHIRLFDDLPRTATNKVEKYKLREAVLSELKTRRP
ncbi:AMP-binding protein [Kitasatospora indigofera]|uniref:AMP-binding protein n=1 Tax=Kitasatospora indigofera TaxID=67307 RepID=UPI0036A9CD32